jgi:ATP-dependent Clp protease ATP-binding subunit ClpA
MHDSSVICRPADIEPNSVLFIDEIHLLLGAGSASGSMDAANILKPALARGAIRVDQIGSRSCQKFGRPPKYFIFHI